MLKESDPKLRHSIACEAEWDVVCLSRLITDAESTGIPLRVTDREEDNGRANQDT